MTPPYSSIARAIPNHTQDAEFYRPARFVTHIDDNAIETLTRYYGSLIPPNQAPSILDLCGSWISHLPMPLPPGTKVAGIGMNEEELRKNPVYTEWKVFDLNESESQQWTWLNSDTMDIVICTVSIDYLIYPLVVLKECHRLLKSGTRLHS
jgi:hypothetical protein